MLYWQIDEACQIWTSKSKQEISYWDVASISTKWYGDIAEQGKKFQRKIFDVQL